MALLRWWWQLRLLPRLTLILAPLAALVAWSNWGLSLGEFLLGLLLVSSLLLGDAFKAWRERRLARKAVV